MPRELSDERVTRERGLVLLASLGVVGSELATDVVSLDASDVKLMSRLENINVLGYNLFFKWFRDVDNVYYNLLH